MNEYTRYIMRWMVIMARRYGGEVVSKDGSRYDWGQAICREQYGKDHRRWPDEATVEDMERAKEWESGKWPEWVRR